MATTAYTRAADSNARVLGINWLAIPNGNQGDPYTEGWFNDRSVQVTGTFGTGGSVTIQGSNDGSTWATLTDPAGAALTFTSAGLKAIIPLTRYIRPSVTAGDGTTAINVYLFMRGEVK